MAEQFTSITDAEMRALVEAGAGGREIIAYLQLTRFYLDDEHQTRCWVSVEVAARRTGMSRDAFKHALARLTRRRFPIEGGATLPVLTRMERACRNRSAVYNNNIKSAINGGRVRPPLKQFSTSANGGHTDT